MADWTAGYVADVGYTHGYYTELNPLRARLAFAYAGLAFPTVENACELGFGQGISVTLHAAASPVRWAGTDFNPAHASFAQQLAARGGVPALLSDDAFGEFARRQDLPQFDFIGLHGIWSWISAENRAILVEFVRARLKPGGVLYISYNTLPGWAPFAPVRHLMNRYAEAMTGTNQGAVQRVDQALAFAEKVLATDPHYARANPGIRERTQKLREQNKQYLAHEYFNRDWNPMHFADAAAQLQEAKLQFGCSAHLGDLLPSLNFSAAQQQLLAELPDRELRESVRDYLVNQTFRRDLWVKGCRQLTPYERLEEMARQRILLIQPRADVPRKISGPAGTADLLPAIYDPLLEVLGDHQPRTIAALAEQARAHGMALATVCEAVMMLCTLGAVVPVQEEQAIEQARARTEAVNNEICRLARTSTDIAVLASPVTGGGHPVSRISQMFLLARSQGRAGIGDMASFTWDLLNAQGQRLVVEGKAIESRDENVAELERRGRIFVDRELPLLRALGIARNQATS